MAVASKGFVNTLEAIIASTLMLGIVLTVSNYASISEPGFEVDSQVESGLENLDRQGMITSDSATLEDKVEPYVPGETEFAVAVTEVEKVSKTVNLTDSSYEKTLDDEGEYREIKLWVEEEDEITVSFGEDFEEVLEDSGYFEVSLPTSEGDLRVSGGSELDLRIETYIEMGEGVEDDHVVSVNRVVPYNNSVLDVEVRMWR